MRRVALLIAVGLFLVALTPACKKGLPEECDQYLQKYDCYLSKSGVAEHQSTVSTMRQTWTSASNTSQGRAAVLSACQQSEAQMSAKFKELGCTATSSAK